MEMNERGYKIKGPIEMLYTVIPMGTSKVNSSQVNVNLFLRCRDQKACDVMCCAVDTKFKQQKLPAWQPILTAGTVLPLLFAIGIGFIPIGVAFLITANNVCTNQLIIVQLCNVDRTPSLTEFHRSVFLICTFAYIVHQLVLSCYAHVLHLFFIIVSQFQLQFPLLLMFLTSVGAFSSFCHADTISHAR